jgi:uncharacterized GH25 family protein
MTARHIHRGGRWAALLAMLLLGPAVPVMAHEFWLAPSRYVPVRGEAVEIRVHVGDGFHGPIQSYATSRAVRFELRAARAFALDSLVRNHAPIWARFTPNDSGGAMVAWESGFTRNELPAARFEAYLKDDGLDSALALRQAEGATGPGVERYRRCAKTWLTGAAESRATEPFGLPFEIVPAAIPGQDSTLSVQILYEGRPAPGVLVRAWRAPLDPGGMPLDASERPAAAAEWSARSDGNGMALVPCASNGEWMISAVHMVRSRDRAAADWESSWASLTFQR